MPKTSLSDSSTVSASLPRAPARPLIRLDALQKVYDEGGGVRTVLKGVEATFYEGEFVCLLGKSGSGKSTLLNLISGIDTPSGGEVFIRDASGEIAMTRLSERERTLFRRRHIGIVFQLFNLIPTLTVLENVMLPLELGGGGAPEQALKLLERVGLHDRASAYPDKLSGGEQQRVAIARALVHEPLLLLADEPTGNLDTETGKSVLALLLNMSRDAGKTLIMATHAIDIARQADRALLVENGHLIEAANEALA